MIVPMTKYDIVLFRPQKEEFLEKLQDTGLVDITTTGWEPDDRERELIISVEKHKAAVKRLRAMSEDEAVKSAMPFEDGQTAWDNYQQASAKIESIDSATLQLQKEIDELKVWGSFDPEPIRKLQDKGIMFRYFSAFAKEFERNVEQWSESYTIVPVNTENGITYFVVLSSPGQEILINAQELKPLTYDSSYKEQELARLETEREEWEKVMDRAAASVELIQTHGVGEQEKVDLSRAIDSGSEEAEGTLVVMEGWATRETEANVDTLLAEYPNLFFIKSAPTPDDETPVLLKNGRYSRLFEFIGGFYSLPKYGTIDLTPYFAPFYMIFFGFCLADAGYGLLLFLGGLFLALKQTGTVKQVGKLTMWCGGATIVFGFLVGSFFGIDLTGFGPFIEFKKYFLDADKLFILALGLGIFQILFGMCIKVANTTKQFGFRYSLSTIGWMIVIISSLAAIGGPHVGFEVPDPLFYTLLGIGLFMMLFLNSPGKNPFANFGAGLWNTYNDVTGILSDVLSYIRLFAIGLSGGILASVFNQLAFGMAPDIPVVKQLVILLILLIGHSINLFMATLSSFVHPMRLTFVEFYKNAGFDTTQRAFQPLKRSEKNN